MRGRGSGLAPGLALVVMGLILFLGNLFGHWGAVVLATAGVALLAISLQSANRRFAVPGCLALALAVFVGLLDTGALRSHIEIWLLLFLSGAFLGIYLLRCRWGNLYPLSIAAVLAFAAIDGLLGLHLMFTGRTWSELGRWWPLLVILLGGWMLLGTRLRIPASRLIGPGFVFLAGAALILAAGNLWAGPPWAPFTGPAGVRGLFNMPAVPGGPPWPMFARADATVSEVLDQSVDASQGTSLSVANDTGSTRVYQAEGQEILIHATKQVWAVNDSAARQALDGMSVDIVTSDGRVEVRPRSVDESKFLSFGPPRWMDMEIGVPAGVAIQVASGTGRIRVDGAAGELSVTSKSGKVEMDNVRGKVDVSLTSGDLRASNVTGEMSARSTSGNLEVVRVTGLRELATTSGRIVVDGALRQAANISTASGDVRIFASPDSAFWLDYTTASGSIRYDVPLAVEFRDKHRLTGSYNQGNALLTIRTTSGDLRIMRSGS